MGRKVIVLGLALTLLGCTDDSGDDDATPRPTTTQPSTTTTDATTTTEPDDEAQLRQLAEDWWETSRALYLDSDRSTDEISDYLTGDYLTGTVSQVEDFRETGNTSQLAEGSRHVIEEVVVNGTSAVLTECFVNADVLLDQDGNVLDDSVATRRYDTTASLGADGWRLVLRTQLGESQGGDQCGE